MSDAEKDYADLFDPPALAEARRDAHEETRRAVWCAVMEHFEAVPGLADVVADGAVAGVADALDQMPRRSREGRADG